MATPQQRLVGKRPSRRVAPTVSVLVAGLVLSGCTSQEPSSAETASHDIPISISVNATSSEQMVLGEIYHQTLLGQDRNSSLALETDPAAQGRMSRLQEGEVNFIVGCTGELLGSMNPETADAITEEFGLNSGSGAAADANYNDLSQRIYDEFVGSLPGGVTTTDPSPAQGCKGDEYYYLPQNIVPVFNKELFTRAEMSAINNVTRSLSSEEIDKLITRARRQGSVSAVVADWLSTTSSVYDQEAATSEKSSSR